jgi:HK97 family phage major capsid protein
MPPEDLALEIKAEISRIGSENRAALDGYRREMVAAKSAASESKTYADALHRAVDERVSVLQNSVDELSTVMNRRFTGSDALSTAAKIDTPESKAFRSYLRGGREALSPDEYKALHSLHSLSDPAGGVLAPPEFVRELIRELGEQSPLRRLARTIETGAGRIELPRLTSGATAFWRGELAPVQETSLSFGATEIPIGELSAFTDISFWLVEDADIDVTRVLAESMAAAFAGAESAAMLGGDGIGKPLGLLHAADLPEVKSGHATELRPDALIDAVYRIKGPYSRNGTWLMNRSTAGIVRKMKDSAGRFLWDENAGGLVPGQPSLLLGRPVELDDALPDIAAGSTPIVFADWRRAMWIVSKPAGGVSITRDELTQRGSGLIRFWARQRVGAGLVQPEAAVKIKISA